LHYKEEYLSLINDLKINRAGILAAEKNRFGLDHTDIGAAVMNQWKLPSIFALVAKNHHTSGPESIIGDESKLIDIVALADRLTMGPFDDCFPDIEKNIEFVQAACARLGIESAIANRIRKESILESIKLAEYLELDIGDILEILTEANDKLAELYFSLEKIFLEKRRLQEIIDASPRTESAAV